MVRIVKHFKGGGLKAQLLRGTGGVLTLNVASLFLTLISGVLLARTLGSENYGVYSFLLSLIALLGLPTQAGLPTLLIREIAKNQLNKKWGLIRGILKSANIFSLGYSVSVTILVGLSILCYLEVDDNIKLNTFLWGLLLLPLHAFDSVRSGALRGLRWVVFSRLSEQLIRPLVMIILFGTSFFLGKEMTSVTAVKFNVIATFLAFILGAYFLVKAIPDEVKKSEIEFDLKPWVSSFLPLCFFSGLQIIDSQISVVLLGFMGSSEEVGLFRVAATVASLVAFGLTAVNMALAPQVARLYDSGEIKKLQKVITLSIRAVAMISLPVAFVFITWGEEIITIGFGSEYVAAAGLLVILCVGQLVNTSAGSVVLLLNMTGHEKEIIKAVFVSLSSNLLFAVILIPKFGVYGAVYGYVSSLIIWNILLAIRVKSILGIKSFIH